MTKLGRPSLILDIVEEHFEELDFLWEQREGVIFAPDWTFKELAELEERAEAHLDGLRIAEGHAVDIARPALTGKETFAATAATFVFMETREPDLAQEVLDALDAAAGNQTGQGIRLGLRYSPIHGIREALMERTSSDDLALAAAAGDVLAFHRVRFPDPHRLLNAEEPATRVLALLSLGRLGEIRQQRDLQSALDAPEAAVRRAGLQAAAMAGSPGLSEFCRRTATDGTKPEALAFLGVLGDRTDLSMLEKATRDPERAVPAIQALGALGVVEAIPVLLDLMRNDALAHAAGLAFIRLCGAEGIEEESREPASDEEAETEDSFDEEEPKFDPEKAGAWWESNRERFAQEEHWQAGLQISKSELGATSNLLPLACRRDVYLEQRTLNAAKTPDIELERRARDQLPDC